MDTTSRACCVSVPKALTVAFFFQSVKYRIHNNNTRLVAGLLYLITTVNKKHQIKTLFLNVYFNRTLLQQNIL